MKKYLGIVRIKEHYIQTVIFADCEIHAKLLLEYQYGFNSLLNKPKLIEEADTTIQPTIMMPPEANLKPALSFKQQKRLVQKKKMSALIQQQANNELKQKSQVKPIDIAASLIRLGNIKNRNQP